MVGFCSHEVVVLVYLVVYPVVEVEGVVCVPYVVPVALGEIGQVAMVVFRVVEVEVVGVCIPGVVVLVVCPVALVAIDLVVL